MTHLPNTITLLRIAGSLGLLLCDVTGVAYWITYVFCGISGIVEDGWQIISYLVPAIIAWYY